MEQNATINQHIASKETTKVRYKIHWHVIIIHFPISFFTAAFGFQVLHLFFWPECFELASTIALIAGALALIPTLLTGWISWRKNYKSAHTKIFNRKIFIGIFMLVFCFFLLATRIPIGITGETHGLADHILYLAGTTALIICAVLEGLFGGLLNHR
jgi:uncharacterized membrane protein